MTNLLSTDIANEVRQWLQAIVIGLNLCPFAQRELVQDSVRIIISEADSELKLMQDLNDELSLLEQDEAIETTLLIHPYVLRDFDDYNQFLSLADKLLQDRNFEGVFQIASFHPHYQFEGSMPDDAENYSNRSPYPMLHLLRESSVEKAVADYKHIEDIPARNMDLLRTMGAKKIEALLTDSAVKNLK